MTTMLKRTQQHFTPRLLAIFTVGLALSTGACESVFDQPPPLVAEDDGMIDLFVGEGVGDDCDESDGEELFCRSGLVCVDGACQPTGDKTVNDKCLLTAECQGPTKECDESALSGMSDAQRLECVGLHCGWAGFCVESNTLAGSDTDALGVFGALLSGDKGSPCATASECRHNLVCKFQGLGGTCQPVAEEAGDLDEPCGNEDGEPEILNCMAGLACSSKTLTCVPGSIFLNPDLFGGEPYCQDYYESLAPFGVRSLVPRSGQPSDFYSLPFPNDHRRDENGMPDISAHPLPGGGLIGIDPLSAIAEALPKETDGWSTQAGIFFRFTREVDPESLTGNVHLIHLEDGTEHPHTSTFTAARNKYICSNYLMVQPRWGTPLKPRATYAAIITNGVQSTPNVDDEIESAQRIDDTAALLSDQSPSDAALTEAWNSYQPLRDYLASGSGMDAASIVGATVFTTNSPTDRMQDVYDAVIQAEQIAIATSPVLCKAGTTSPCSEILGAADTTDAGTEASRDCPENPDPDFHEIHAKVRLPMVQSGKRPYLLDGGALEIPMEGGEPQFEYENVCMSLTIPTTQAMPATGWPVMIYGHGTGGTYRTGAAIVGDRMARLTTEGGTPTPIAVIGIDAPMHGERKGTGLFAQLDSGPLYYNFTNPPAAKGNFYQGAADVFALVELAKKMSQGIAQGLGPNIQIQSLPQNVKDVFQGTKFDPNRIMYHGHSQGGATGPLVTPFATDLDQVVVSGTGGSLVYGLLGKKQPYDVSTGMSIALQEISLNEQHPALHLMQYYFDEVDATPYGALMSSQNVMHQLHVYGVDDTYTPPDTSAIYASSTGGSLITPNPEPGWYADIPFYPMDVIDLSSGPVTQNAGEFTRATVVAKSTGELADHITSTSAYDGHFVIYKDKNASRWFEQWMATWVDTGVPTIVQ